MTDKLPKALMAAWKALFGAAWREGYPDGGPGDQGEAWTRFLAALPNLLRQPASTRAEVVVAGWLFEEFVSREAAAVGLVASYGLRAGGGLRITWTTAGGYFGTDCDPSDN
jgi:hypothetical protein